MPHAKLHARLQVLEARLDRHDTEWVAQHAADLLRSLRKSTGSQQLKCNRTRLMMLSMRCRLDEGTTGFPSTTEQRQLFSAWPHSIQVWNLFSRCAHSPDIAHVLTRPSLRLPLASTPCPGPRCSRYECAPPHRPAVVHTGLFTRPRVSTNPVAWHPLRAGTRMHVHATERDPRGYRCP